MDGGSKRGCATVSMAKELASFVPAFCAGSILYGTCAAGEAYVVFGSSFNFSKYVSNSKSALGGDMALKLRSYKAVAAAGHALPIHLPPPMAAPSASQISQLRALRSLKLLVVVGVVGVVGVNAVVAYRQGAEAWTQAVLQGSCPVDSASPTSPYVMRAVGCVEGSRGRGGGGGSSGADASSTDPVLLLRLGRSREVEALLRDAYHNGSKPPMPLPVLMRGGDNRSLERKAALRRAVLQSSGGAHHIGSNNDKGGGGCYVHQDMLGNRDVLPLPEPTATATATATANVTRAIVQAGGLFSTRPTGNSAGGCNCGGEKRESVAAAAAASSSPAHRALLVASTLGRLLNVRGGSSSTGVTITPSSGSSSSKDGPSSSPSPSPSPSTLCVSVVLLHGSGVLDLHRSVASVAPGSGCAGGGGGDGTMIAIENGDDCANTNARGNGCAITVDARAGLVADLLGWVDLHRIGTSSSGGVILATSSSNRGGRRAALKAGTYDNNGYNEEEEEEEEDYDGMQAWVAVDRVGEGARVLLVGSWRALAGVAARSKDAVVSTWPWQLGAAPNKGGDSNGGGSAATPFALTVTDAAQALQRHLAIAAGQGAQAGRYLLITLPSRAGAAAAQAGRQAAELTGRAALSIGAVTATATGYVGSASAEAGRALHRGWEDVLSVLPALWAAVAAIGTDTNNVPKRRRVLLDLGNGGSVPYYGYGAGGGTAIGTVLAWLGYNNSSGNELGGAVLAGLLQAGVEAAPWTGGAAALPDLASASASASAPSSASSVAVSKKIMRASAPLVIICRPPSDTASGSGDRDQKARALAAQYASRGYRCCIVDSTALAGDPDLLSPSPSSGSSGGHGMVSTVGTRGVEARLWAQASLLLAAGHTPPQAAAALQASLDQRLRGE